MQNSTTCVICNCEITVANDSSEHVIPNSIGGRKKLRGFLCVTCNNSAGESWDRELALQLNELAVALGIRRERGASPDQVIKTADGTELVLRTNGTLTRRQPFFETSISDDGNANIKMFARAEGEAKTMLRGIKKKYPAFDLEGELSNLEIGPYRVDVSVQRKLVLGGADAGRSVVKTAVAACVEYGIPAQACDIGIYTLKTSTDDRGFALFYLLDIVPDRPQDELCHLVSIQGDSENRTLLAYVEYFGAMRILVKLSERYVGETFIRTFSLNPRTGEELDLTVNWAIPKDELDAAFRGWGVNRFAFDMACQDAFEIAEGYRVLRERRHLLREDLAAVLKEMGLLPDGIPEGHDIERFNRLMEARLGLIDELKFDIPHLPDL